MSTFDKTANKQPPASANNHDLPLIWLDELLEMPNKSQEMILSPWLPKHGLAMIYAKRGIGKTYLALSIAYTIATGGSLLNWHTDKPQNVLYIDGEMTSQRLAERLPSLVKADQQHHIVQLAFLTPDKLCDSISLELVQQLKTATDDRQRQLLLHQVMSKTKMIDLANPEDQARLLPIVMPFDVIIVDNISTLCPSAKENEADTWAPVQYWAILMRAMGKTVLFVHHAGKSGSQRGTSKREDILDTVITLKPSLDIGNHHSNDTSITGACFEVHFEKARGFYGDETKPFRAELITQPDGKQQWQHQILQPSLSEKIASLKAQGNSHQQIANALGVSKSTVSRHLQGQSNIQSS